jgi:hypothetical protein
MDQSKSNNVNSAGQTDIALPRRRLTVEFAVGVFALAGLAAAAYLAVGLAGLEIGTSNLYRVYAEFDNVAGLKPGAAVEIAGVKVVRSQQYQAQRFRSGSGAENK